MADDGRWLETCFDCTAALETVILWTSSSAVRLWASGETHSRMRVSLMDGEPLLPRCLPRAMSPLWRSLNVARPWASGDASWNTHSHVQSQW